MRLIRRFHKWMLHNVQWWVYTRGDVSEISKRHAATTAAIRQRSTALAKLDVARYEQARWAKQMDHWANEWCKAEDEVLALLREEE